MVVRVGEAQKNGWDSDQFVSANRNCVVWILSKMSSWRPLIRALTWDLVRFLEMFMEPWLDSLSTAEDSGRIQSLPDLSLLS
jgi:hypothetical protein